MELYLAKPDLVHFKDYTEMMKEWLEFGGEIAPWFLNEKVNSLEDFYLLVQKLDESENANQDKGFASTTSYLVEDESGKLIGAASLRHYLTIKGLNSWGHIGYGVRPSERRKGYATKILKMVLQEAKKKKIYKVLLSAYKSNIASHGVIEKCGGVFDSEVPDPDNSSLLIKKYWINNR